ncbi:MAG: PEP-CTERM sorting domain-containing protein [Akkermansia sp.]|nr:PEP-CTERM sorting domain-containing protein [Akkermansia sp.]
MKLHLPKRLFAAVVAAICGTAWAADMTNWNVATDSTGNIVFTTTLTGQYDVSLGAAAITTGKDELYSIDVQTTKESGWNIPTGDVGNGMVVACTATSGSPSGGNAFTVRVTKAEDGSYQGKTWINNWWAYNVATLKLTEEKDSVKTVGVSVGFVNDNGTKRLRVDMSGGSDLQEASGYLINDANLVSSYNYSTLSNKGLGDIDYSDVSTTVTVTKTAASAAATTWVGTVTATNSVGLANAKLGGTLATAEGGSFTFSGNTDVSALQATGSSVRYGETAEGATENGNGYSFGTFVYKLGADGTDISFAEGSTFTTTSVSEGTGEYDRAKGELTITNSQAAGVYTINTGVTIDYTTGSAIASTATTGIVVNAADTTINMGSGTTINKSDLTANAATKLGGSGTYIANSATTLGDNISLDDNWTGTVQLTGNLNTSANFFATAGKTGSTIELKGVNKWTSNWNGNISQNLKLTNNGNSAAWVYGAYYTDNTGQYNTSATTFSGTWSGDGNFMTNIDNGNVRGMRYKFTGDISGWTGAFKVSATNANSVGIFEVGGNAHVVNAVIQRDSGILKVAVDTDVTFNQSINNATEITINAGKAVTMKQNLTVSSLVMGEGSSLSLRTEGSNRNLRMEGAANISNLTVQDLDFKQYADVDTAKAGTYDVNLSGTNSVYGLLDLSRGSKTGADIVVKEGGSLAHSGENLWMCNTNAGILLEEGASFSRMDLFTVKGLSSAVTEEADSRGQVVWNNASADGKFNDLGQASVTIRNAELTVNNANAAVTVSTILDHVTIKAEGSNMVNINSDATLTGVDTAGGLTINSGKTVQLSGHVANLITNKGTLNISGNLTASGFQVTEGESFNVGLDGNVTTGDNYFSGGKGGDTITLVDNSGTLTPNGATVTQNDVVYTLQDNGTAVSAATQADYTTFYMGSSSLNVEDIANASTAHSATLNTVEMSGGSLTVNADIANVIAKGGTVDIAEGKKVTGNLEVAENATVTGKIDADKVKIDAGKTATMTDGLEAGAITFSKEDGGVKVLNTGSEATQYSVTESAIQVTADTLEATAGATVKNQLAVGSIVNKGTDTLVIDGEVTGVQSITAESGDITLNKVAAAIELSNLSVGSQMVGVYTDGTNSAESTISIGTDGTLYANTDGTLYANLTLASGSTLALDGILTLGSTLTLGSDIKLDGALAADISALEEGGSVTLIQTANGKELTYGAVYNGADAATYFTGLGDGYTIVADTGSFSIKKAGSVPEPTTGTLSLLALAGLMARRRRK